MNESLKTFIPSPPLQFTGAFSLPSPDLPNKFLFPTTLSYGNRRNEQSLVMDNSNGKAKGANSETRVETSSTSAKYVLEPLQLSSPPSKKSKGKKRQLSYEERFGENRNALSWPKYYVMQKDEGDFCDISPIQLCKMVHSLIGKTANVKKTPAGKIHIETRDARQAKSLCEVKQLGEFSVSVTPNKRLNTSQGVITCRDFIMCTEEEILEELEDQGVLEVRRIRRRVAGALQGTASLVLTFNNPEPAKVVTAAYYKLTVRPFVPSPMRCYKCLKFGHTSTRCKALEAMCGCGLVIHGDAACQDPPQCINCGASHNTRASVCEVFKEEREIQKLKVEKKMPYFEARSVVRSKFYAKPTVSFAQVVESNKKMQREISTQTESVPLHSAQAAVGTQSDSSKLTPSSLQMLDGAPFKRPADLPALKQKKSLVIPPTSSEIPSANQAKALEAPTPSPISENKPIEEKGTPKCTPITWAYTGGEASAPSDGGEGERTCLSETSDMDVEPVRSRRKKRLPGRPKKYS